MADPLEVLYELNEIMSSTAARSNSSSPKSLIVTALLAIRSVGKSMMMSLEISEWVVQPFVVVRLLFITHN